MLWFRNACAIRLKVNSLTPNVQRCNRTLIGNTSGTDAIESHRFDFRRGYALLDGRCVMNVLKGMSGEPTSC
jgi:hypothetical protein